MTGLLGPRAMSTGDTGGRRTSLFLGKQGQNPHGIPLKAGLCLSGLLLKEGCRRPPRLNAHWLPGLPCALVSTGGSSCMEAARDADCVVKPAWAGRTLGGAGRTLGAQATYWPVPSHGCWCMFPLHAGFRPRVALGPGVLCNDPLTVSMCIFLDMSSVTHFLERRGTS